MTVHDSTRSNILHRKQREQVRSRTPLQVCSQTMLEIYFLKDLAMQILLVTREDACPTLNVYRLDQPAVGLPLKTINPAKPGDVYLFTTKEKKLAGLINYDRTVTIEDQTIFYNNIPEQFPKGFIYQALIAKTSRRTFIVFRDKRETMIASQQLISNLKRQSLYSILKTDSSLSPGVKFKDIYYNTSCINTPQGVTNFILPDDMSLFIDSVLRLELLTFSHEVEIPNGGTSHTYLVLPSRWGSVTVPSQIEYYLR